MRARPAERKISGAQGGARQGNQKPEEAGMGRDASPDPEWQ